MTTRTATRTDTRRSLMWAALLAALWVVVAILRPDSTFHLAPLLVAGAPPVLLALDEGTSVDRGSVLRIGAIGSALSVGTAFFLLTVGAMQGPAFEAFPGPFGEAFVFTAAGASVGIGIGWWRTR